MDNTSRSLMLDDNYKPAFSGHETFPLRYGWLKKAYDAILEASRSDEASDVFNDEASIARFGVGRNMVAAIRHWAVACGVCESKDAKKTRSIITKFGHLIFADDGLDPFLESPATLWLLHWELASYSSIGVRQNKTTWQWVFNYLPGMSFEKDDLIAGIKKFAETCEWTRLAPITIKNDVECFIRTYESRQADRSSTEDALSSPLSELGLIRGFRGHFQLIRGPKPSLPNPVFVLALDQFWKRLGSMRSLSFEAVAYERGSPGRIFLLDEADLAERLFAIEEVSNGIFTWSETAGLKQVLRTAEFTEEQISQLYRQSYMGSKLQEAA